MSLPIYRDVPAVDVVVADRVDDVELGDVDEAGVVGTHRQHGGCARRVHTVVQQVVSVG